MALVRFIVTHDARGLGRNALRLLAAHVAQLALEASANWLMAGVSQRALQSLRRSVFAHLSRLPQAFFERREPGSCK